MNCYISNLCWLFLLYFIIWATLFWSKPRNIYRIAKTHHRNIQNHKKKTIYICKAHLKVSVHLFKWNIYIYPNLWFESPEKKQIQLLQKSLNNKDPDFYVQQFQKIWNLS